METTVVAQAEQTSVKIVIVRGGKAPKTEVKVSSICMKGDEKELVKLLIDAHKDINKQLESTGMGATNE